VDFYTMTAPTRSTKSAGLTAVSSRQPISKRTDWVKRFAEALTQKEFAPPGWLTIQQWADRIGNNFTTAARLLKKAKADGCARSQLFKPRNGENLNRTQSHWWVDGVSDKIAKQAAGSKSLTKRAFK
jgi:hypothetical protein